MKKKLLSIILLTSITMNIFMIKSNALPNLDGLNDTEKIQVIDNEIITTMEKIEQLEKEIKDTEKEIREKEIEIYELKKEYREEELYSNYSNSGSLRTNSSNSQIEELKLFDMLLNSKNLTDFFKQIELNNELKFKESKIAQTLSSKKTFIENMQNDLEKKKEDLKKDKINIEKEKKELDELKKEVEEEIKNRPKTIANIVAPKIDNVNNAKAKDILNEAFNYLGVPYVWGGTTPNGFDCSGFVQYVYAKNGISLPRVSQSQQNVGTKVSSSEAQAGDLLFFGYPAYHVAIYIGNGQYIHAPQTGDVVKISNVDWGSISSISRIIN